MKKLLVFLLVTVMLCVSVPFSVSADDTVIYVGGVAMTDGDYLANGATATVKTQPAESGYAYYKDGVLTLNSYEYAGEGYLYTYSHDSSDQYASCLYSPSDLEIVFEGISYLENTASDGDCITVYGNLAIDGDDESGIQLNGYYGFYVYSLEKNVTLTCNGGIVYALGTVGMAVDCTAENCYAKVVINDGLLAFETNENSISIYSEYDAYLEVNGGETAAMSDLLVYACYGNADITVNRGALYAMTDYIAISVYSEYSDMETILSTVTINGGDLYAYGSTCGVYADEIFVLGGEFRVAYDAETNPDGALYTGGITAVDGMGEIGTTLDSEYGIGVYETGDVNTNGLVDASDYLILKRICFGTYKVWGSESTRADIDGNEMINATDYLLLKRICFNTYTAE